MATRPSRDGRRTVGARLRPGHRFGTQRAIDRAANAGHDRSMPERKTDRDARRLAELTFLEEVARLATSARTWDELMWHDHRPGDRRGRCRGLLALPHRSRRHGGHPRRDQRPRPGARSASPACRWASGITGRVARDRRPLVSVDVQRDRRFAWLQGLDEPRLTSMCSVPLIWNDAVVGVLNVQTVRRRVFRAARRPVPRDAGGAARRDRREGPSPARRPRRRSSSLRAIDEARAAWSRSSPMSCGRRWPWSGPVSS